MTLLFHFFVPFLNSLKVSHWDKVVLELKPTGKVLIAIKNQIDLYLGMEEGTARTKKGDVRKHCLQVSVCGLGMQKVKCMSGCTLLQAVRFASVD